MQQVRAKKFLGQHFLKDLSVAQRIAETITAGRVLENHVTYEFTDLNSIKPEMIAQATQAARQAGEKFAKDSDSNLGKIKSATWFS